MMIYLASPYTPTESQIDAELRAMWPHPKHTPTDINRELAANRIKRDRFDAAVAATAALMQAGAHVISPIASSHPVAIAHTLPGDFGYWKALDLDLIDRCDEVWVLTIDGWEASAGIKDEVAYALAHNKQVRYIDPSDVAQPLRDAPAPVAPAPVAPAPERSCFTCKRNYESGSPICAECPDPAYPHWEPAPAPTANPKDRLGAAKVSLTKLPAVACLHAAAAMGDGARKYGAYNWRSKPVLAGIYVDACKRHLEAWFDREEVAADSGVHHLGHAMACCAILLDAQETGNLIDDRPESAGAFCRVLSRLNAEIAAKAGA